MKRLARAALAAFALSLAVVTSAAAAAAAAHDARYVMTLGDGWRFKQDGAVTGAEALSFADADWPTVSVPHTWNRVGYYLTDPSSHLNRADNTNKSQGVGWYRLKFTPPAGLAGRKIWLEFDAASRIATVWLNGVPLGEHKGGFSRFRLDATAAAHAGQANLLVVKVDNSQPASGSSTADVLPLTGDFFVHGGLYRPVRVVATDPVHIDMMDLGGPGVYARTLNADAKAAAVEVRTRLVNDGDVSAPAKVYTRLIDQKGQTAAVSIQPVELAPGKTFELKQALSLARPHLWQGRASAYLYHLTSEVRAKDGRVLDRLDQAFGVRTIRLDPDKGMFLNGRPLRLHGVGYHQDHEGKGWAISPADVDGDLKILMDMGVNTVRLTHYQHGQTVHDLADRYGLILWDEIPLVSAWTLDNKTEPTPELRANAVQQLRELIRQNFNHPSVANWNLANEVDFGNDAPGFLPGASTQAPDPMPLLKELHDVERAEDPGRPSSIATCCEARATRRADTVIPITAKATDISGANRYFGWYYGKADELGAHLDQLHAQRPSQPEALTEYGAGAALTIHTDDVLGGSPDSGGVDQPEEYQSYVHERSWPQIRSRSYLWSSWLWSAFDFSSTVRREGDSQDVNTKGLVSYDRKVKKDAYFFYRANWTGNPTVHINGRRYPDRAYASTEVRVYSNAPKTELWLNGRLVGAQTDCSERVCVWPKVRLSAGENKISARGLFASRVTEDQVAWRLAPEAAQAVRIDSGALVAAKAGVRYGSDAFFSGGRADTVYPSGRGPPRPKPPIAGASDAAVEATYREGDFRYDIPLPDGAYTVTLDFIEPSAKPGERTFSVLANGAVALADVDVAALGGAPLTLVRRSFPVQVSNGALALKFAPGKGQAIVSAVQVVRAGS